MRYPVAQTVVAGTVALPQAPQYGSSWASWYRAHRGFVQVRVCAPTGRAGAAVFSGMGVV